MSDASQYFQIVCEAEKRLDENPYKSHQVLDVYYLNYTIYKTFEVVHLSIFNTVDY